MITWYADKELKIEFSVDPDVRVLHPNPHFDDKQNEIVTAKPFMLTRDIDVAITYRDFRYSFTVPEGYTWDGASIPRLFWRIIGPPTSPSFLTPSFVHDVLCENKHYICHNRYLSTLVLERLLYVSGVGPFRRWAMKHSVDNWQKFRGWGKW